jgi:hypothetical protein
MERHAGLAILTLPRSTVEIIGDEDSAVLDPATLAERIYTMLKSLSEFDKQEIRGVVKNLLGKTDRDVCFLGTYYRAVANVKTLLSLKSAKDLQAIAMVARGLFELAVDVSLIDVIDNSVKKIVTFTAVERLRAARKIVAFKAAHPEAAVPTGVYESFHRQPGSGDRRGAEGCLAGREESRSLVGADSVAACGAAEGALRGNVPGQLSRAELARSFRLDGICQPAGIDLQSDGGDA